MTTLEESKKAIHELSDQIIEAAQRLHLDPHNKELQRGLEQLRDVRKACEHMVGLIAWRTKPSVVDKLGVPESGEIAAAELPHG